MDESEKLLNEFYNLFASSKKSKDNSIVQEDKPVIEEQQKGDQSNPSTTMDLAIKYLNTKSNKDKKPQPVSESIFQNNQNAYGPIEKEQSTPSYVTLDEFNRKFRNIQEQIGIIGGGGEVNFRYLDDVNRATMQDGNDNHILEYDSFTGKVQFTTNIGPIETISFDILHNHDSHPVGTLCWNTEDQTLNLYHPGGPIQQIGQEMYGYVRNNTGSVIPNGTFVQFAGAEQNGTARLEIEPMLADGTYPSLYGFGITTQEFADGEDGRVTVWGKVRDVNASGTNFTDPANNESWNIGDILYVSPIEAGKLTKVKPTAPNNVIPVAAVLNNDAENGELYVRPTIEQQQYYGRFSRTTDMTVQNPNQAYPITFDTTDISNGVTIVSNQELHVVDSGFYQIDFSAQVTATSNKGRAYFWLKKNGENVPDTTHITTVTNGDTFNVTFNVSVSLDTNDYIEVYWARTAAGILLDAIPATAFAPSTASASINISQVQL